VVTLRRQKTSSMTPCARMADMELTPMDFKLLPQIAYASAKGVPPPHPRNFEAVQNLKDLIRPEHGL